MPAIVVEVTPPESRADLRKSLLDACTQAVKSSNCVERGDSEPDPSAIVATVAWRGTDHVRLEITLQSAKQAVEREIDFGPHDAVEERWRSTGLVLGTLASVLARNELPSAGELPEAPESETKRANPGEPEPEPAGPPLPARPDAKETLLRPPHAQKPRSPKTQLLIDLSGLVAPAVVGGSFRSGGELGTRLRFSGVPVEPSAAVSYSESLSDYAGVETRFFDTFVGVAVTGKLGGPFSSVARGEGFVRWLEASVSESGSVGPAAQARVLGGARVGLDGVVKVADPLSVFAGAAGIFAAGSTDITVHRQNVGSGIAALSYQLRLGASLAF